MDFKILLVFLGVWSTYTLGHSIPYEKQCEKEGDPILCLRGISILNASAVTFSPHFDPKKKAELISHSFQPEIVEAACSKNSLSACALKSCLPTTSCNKIQCVPATDCLSEKYQALFQDLCNHKGDIEACYFHILITDLPSGNKRTEFFKKLKPICMKKEPFACGKLFSDEDTTADLMKEIAPIICELDPTSRECEKVQEKTGLSLRPDAQIVNFETLSLNELYVKTLAKCLAPQCSSVSAKIQEQRTESLTAGGHPLKIRGNLTTDYSGIRCKKKKDCKLFTFYLNQKSVELRPGQVFRVHFADKRKLLAKFKGLSKVKGVRYEALVEFVPET